MFGEKFKKKYALTDKGLSNTKKGAFWTPWSDSAYLC